MTGKRLTGGWPLMALFAGYPVWWALGFGPLIVFVLTVPMLLHLARRRRILLPRGIGLYLLFLLFVAVSAVMLTVEPPNTRGSQPLGLPLAYVFRAGSYLGALVVALYLVNTTESELPTRRVVNGLACLFVATVAGGWLGLLLPRFEYTSLVELALPDVLRTNEFIYQMVHPASAQIQYVLGYASPRPKAPYEFTNIWGANLSLLLPLFVLAWRSSAHRGARVGGWLVAAAAVPPVVMSLNRGLWIALFVAAAFGMGHAIRSGRHGIAVAGSVLAIAGAAVFLLSPLLPVVTDRLRNPSSNTPRSYIYAAALDGARASPLLGWGGPRRAAVSDTSIAGARSLACPDCGLNSIGTHGTFWLVAFSHGFVALALFFAFFGSALLQLIRRRSDLHAAAALVVVLFVLETGFYDQLPMSLVIVMAALGLAWRRFTPEANVTGPPQAAPSPAS